jgi:hypothetical protein
MSLSTRSCRVGDTTLTLVPAIHGGDDDKKEKISKTEPKHIGGYTTKVNGSSVTVGYNAR